MMTSAEKEADEADRKLNSKSDTNGPIVLPERLSSGASSSSAAEGDALSAVDGAPSSAKRGGKTAKDKPPSMKKQDVSSFYLCVIFISPYSHLSSILCGLAFAGNQGYYSTWLKRSVTDP